MSTGVSTFRFPRDSLAHPLAPRVNTTMEGPLSHRALQFFS